MHHMHVTNVAIVKLASPIAILVIAACRSASSADEAGGVVRISGTRVLCNGGIDAEWPGEPHGARGRLVIGVLGRNDPLGRDTLLYPALERCLHVVGSVAHGRKLLADPAEAGRAGAEIAVGHAWHHEEAIELLRLAQTAHRARHGLVPLRTIGGLQGLIVPAVILDDHRAHVGPSPGARALS